MKKKYIFYKWIAWSLCNVLILCYSHTKANATCYFPYGAPSHALQQDYTKEYAVATDFLMSKGLKKEYCSFRVTLENEELVMLQGTNSTVFVIMAKSSLHPLMEQPILAYDIENTMITRETYIISPILNFYTNQLKKLRTASRHVGHIEPQSYKAQKNVICPMLKGTKWGQGKPFNLFCKNADEEQNTNQAGCLSIAMTQVMRYHKHPQKGMGQVKYRSNQDIYYSIDLPNYIFNWNAIKDTYNVGDTNTTNTYPIARLISGVAMSIHADFGKEGTPANMANAKTALTYNLGYSPHCRVISHVPADIMLGLAYRELDNERPFILSGGNHAFVCDGRDNEFLHFNMGWYGIFDGYFRIVVLPDADAAIFTSDMLIDIEPDKQQDYAKTVHVDKPGALSDLLTQEEQQNLRKLTLTGCINAQDMTLIRRMAGSSDNRDYFKQTGSLTHLDLSKVQFKTNNTEPYLSMNTKEYSSFTVWTNNYNVSINGMYFTTKQDDGVHMNYTMKNKTIGCFMFFCCMNLQEVILPENTQEIGMFAFCGCNSIRKIDLPSRVFRIGKKAFSQMSSLEMVTYVNPIKPENIGNDLFQDCEIAAKRLIKRKD
ncbi:MAG: C10 family peptidase [Prevotellaceae bacterium]|nr:C10 family peptidase [Prevotellaceae bacterium]